jgi:rhamnosyltransferase
MILGVIVTYNPNFKDLERNIIAIKGQLNKLIVFDNNSTNQDFLMDLSVKWNIEILLHPDNIGLGAAYNLVFKKYFSDFDYFVTFDQDTFLDQDVIPRLLSLFDVSEKAGIVGPSFIKSNFKTNNGYSFVDSLIQSCSIFPKEVLETVGYFDEKLFIDSVDFEYCLRVQLGGYKIIRSNSVFIAHDLGVAKKRYGLSYIEHSALRNYYMARNHKYLTRRYFKNFPYFILKKNFFFFLHCLKLIFLDQDFNKVKSVSKGLKEKFI